MSIGQASEPITDDQNSNTPDSRAHGLLSELEQLIRAQGIKTSLSRRGGLRLCGSETSLSSTDRVELIAFSPEGWEVAMVTVGDRSGCYMVSLPSAGVGSRPVSGGRPHTVVDLIVAALPKGKLA